MSSAATTSSAPSLSDYARSIWRRKTVVIVCAVIGFVVGALALPLVISTTASYTATQRVAIRPLTAKVIVPNSITNVPTPPKSQGGTSTQSAAPADVSYVPDIGALQVVLNNLGNQHVKKLDVLAKIPKADWLGTVASSLGATSDFGSDVVEISFTDSSPALAKAVAGGYAAEYVARRNASNAAQVQAGLTSLENQLNATFQQIVTLSNEVDQQTNPTTGTTASTETTTQLALAKADWTSQKNTLEDIRKIVAFSGAPTNLVGPTTLTKVAAAISKKILAVVGLLLGLLIGLGVALFMEAARPKLVAPYDVERATGLRSLGAVARKPRDTGDLPVVQRPLEATAEGFQRVRTSLEHVGLGKSIRVLTVVSADPREGRTSVVANVGTTLAREGRDVVLVGADLRRPGGLDQIFGIEPGPGLADLLEGREQDVAHLLVSVTDHLTVLRGGKPTRNPAELLASRPLATLMHSLRDNGAIVLIDSPPTQWAADAMSLAAASDATLLVTFANRSRRRDIAQLADELRDGYNPLGFVLLNTKANAGPTRRDLESAPIQIDQSTLSIGGSMNGDARLREGAK